MGLQVNDHTLLTPDNTDIYTNTRGGSRICGRGGGAQRLPRAPQARRFLEGPV